MLFVNLYLFSFGWEAVSNSDPPRAAIAAQEANDVDHRICRMEQSVRGAHHAADRWDHRILYSLGSGGTSNSKHAVAVPGIFFWVRYVWTCGTSHTLVRYANPDIGDALV